MKVVVTTDCFCHLLVQFEYCKGFFLANLALRFRKDVAFSTQHDDTCCLATKTDSKNSFFTLHWLGLIMEQGIIKTYTYLNSYIYISAVTIT